MKVGFIGLGRMGQVMARRLIDAGHEVGVYNRTPDKIKPLTEAGAKAVDSIKAVANFGDAVFTMVSDDAAALDVVTRPGGLERVIAAKRHPYLRRHAQRRRNRAPHGDPRRGGPDPDRKPDARPT